MYITCLHRKEISADGNLDSRNVLIVFAHHDRQSSFNGALLDTAVDELQRLGYTVKVSELHDKQFNPCLNEADLGMACQ